MWLILFIFLVVLAIGTAIITLLRARNVSSSRHNVVATLTVGTLLVVALLALAFWVRPDNASANGDNGNDKPKEQTINMDKFQVCPNGVSVSDPTFYVRGTNILSPQSVTPQLPANDPDGVIRALFGREGYACQDPLVAVAMSMVQEGMLPFTEREDANEIQDWVTLFASNGEVWLKYVSEAAKRFDGLQWQAQWSPDDGDATFLIADAARDQALPKLMQREEGLPQPWGVYLFKSYYGDTPMLKDLALVADFGWLALPEGQFARTPVLEKLDQPLFPSNAPEQTTTTAGTGNDQSGGGSGNTSGTGGGNNADRHNGDQNGCNGVCGTGSDQSGNGQGTGDGGGTGGGGSCTGSCGGTTPTAPPTTHRPPPPPTTAPPPPPTAPPTTHRPPPPPTTAPPTTRPPTTTVPPTTAPPTTKAPDPGCAGMPGCTG